MGQKPGMLQSMGLQRAGHDLVTALNSYMVVLEQSVGKQDREQTKVDFLDLNPFEQPTFALLKTLILMLY